MKVAALDLGSNSFLLLIAEVENGDIKDVIVDDQTVTRLAQGVHSSRSFHPEALSRAKECFKKYKKLIDNYEVVKVKAVSTSAARDVINKQEFISLGAKYGIPIEVIPGAKEAELTYFGTINSKQTENSIIDIGGGSTEIIGKYKDQIKGWSLDIGSVRLAEIFNAFDKVSKASLEEIDQYIIKQIKAFDSKLPRLNQVIAVAGTPTTLACIIQKIQFSTEQVEGFNITLDQLIKTRSYLAGLSLEERKQLTGIHPKRADVLVCGASILKCVCEYFSVSDVRVSCRGVRFGLARELG